MILLVQVVLHTRHKTSFFFYIYNPFNLIIFYDVVRNRHTNNLRDTNIFFSSFNVKNLYLITFCAVRNRYRTHTHTHTTKFTHCRTNTHTHKHDQQNDYAWLLESIVTSAAEVAMAFFFFFRFLPPPDDEAFAAAPRQQQQ